VTTSAPASPRTHHRPLEAARSSRVSRHDICRSGTRNQHSRSRRSAPGELVLEGSVRKAGNRIRITAQAHQRARRLPPGRSLRRSGGTSSICRTKSAQNPDASDLLTESEKHTREEATDDLRGTTSSCEAGSISSGGRRTPSRHSDVENPWESTMIRRRSRASVTCA